MSRLFVGNLPKDVTEGMLDSFFRAAQYRVESVNLLLDQYARQPRRFAFWTGSASIARIGRSLCSILSSLVERTFAKKPTAQSLRGNST